MTPEEIKIIIFRKKFTIAGLAHDYENETSRPCSREAMSQCIRQVKYRAYPEMRAWLQEKLDEPDLWKDETAASRKKKKTPKAA